MSTVTKSIPKNAIHGLDGQPIILREDNSAPDACALIGKYLGYPVTFTTPPLDAPDPTVYLIPKDDRQRNLTAAERAAVEALVWHAQTYRWSMRRDEPVTFPRVVHSIADESVNDEEQFTFCDEARAFMFAGVIENVFCADAQVIETPHGWLVAVTDRDIELDAMDMIVIHQMEGVCMALSEYTMAPAQNANLNYPGGDVKRHAPDARAAWRDRKGGQAQRIEDGINVILAHLESLNDGVTDLLNPHAATAAKGRGIEALIPPKPTSAGKQSSARRSA